MVANMSDPPVKSPPAADTSQRAADPPRYCRGCNYNLHGLTASRCPECGRAFDPANPKTYRSHPPRDWLRYAKRAAYAVAMLLLLLAGTWGWFFWGWYDEQQALRALGVDPVNTDLVHYTPILTPWPKHHLGPSGFVLERVSYLDLTYRYDITNFTPLAKLTKLQGLCVDCSYIEDLSALARLTDLRLLSLRGTRARNFAPLSGLPKLERLALDVTPASDLNQLGCLTHLRSLSIRNTFVTDVSSLARLKSLRTLFVTGKTTTEAQADALQRDLPNCTIMRE